MFERYTEAARRVIFFARYEAVQFGSSSIETEHILLGLLRENKALLARLGLDDSQSLYDEIQARRPVRPSLAFNVDLPLSSKSKVILAFAAEEADNNGHRHIGSEHLLLGMLRVEEGVGAEVLQRHGLTLGAVREELSRSAMLYQPFRKPPHNPIYLPDTIEIHGSRWDTSYIRSRVDAYSQYSWHWEKSKWKPRDIALRRDNGNISFDTRLAEDSQDFEVVKGGWKKDLCVVCRWELFQTDEDPTRGIGYTNGNVWLCTECYEKFWKDAGIEPEEPAP